MWDWQVVLVSSITFSVILGSIIVIYTFMSAKSMRKQQERMNTLIADVKPGAKVMFAGGFIGEVVSRKDNFVNVRIDKQTVVEVAVYSISNILTD